MRVVVVAFDRRFFDCPVHALDLTVRPGVVHLGQPVVDLMFATDAVENVFERRCVLFAVGELDAPLGRFALQIACRAMVVR